MLELTMTLMREDMEFVHQAVAHYRVFAEVSEKQGEHGTAGIMRSQEFHAEQFASRIRGEIEKQKLDPAHSKGADE